MVTIYIDNVRLVIPAFPAGAIRFAGDKTPSKEMTADILREVMNWATDNLTFTKALQWDWLPTPDCQVKLLKGSMQLSKGCLKNIIFWGFCPPFGNPPLPNWGCLILSNNKFCFIFMLNLKIRGVNLPF